MEIEYERNIEDLVDFNLYCMANLPSQQKSKKSTKRYMIILATLFILIAIEHLIFKDISTGLIFLVFGLLLVYFIWQSFNPRSIRRGLTKRVEEQSGATPNVQICKKKTSIGIDGIYDKSDFGEFKTFWKGIRKIIQTDKYLYFFYTEASAHIVPKRAFLNSDSFNLFAQTAKDLHATALDEKPKI